MSEGVVEEFFQAIKDGDLAVIASLLASDPGLVEQYDKAEFDGTPLSVAVRCGNLAVVDLLLEHGADLSKKSAWWAGGFAPLHTTFWTDRQDMIPALIERGAPVDVHAAAGMGDVDLLTVLLDADPALVHSRGGDGQFPLHFAAVPEVVDCLLERGAEIDARDIDHVSTAAQWAAAKRPAVTAALVERGAASDVFMLSAIGDAARLRGLLERDPSAGSARITEESFPTPGSQGGHIYRYSLGGGATALHVAARCDRPESVAVLLDHGVDPGVRGDYDDATPLHIAAWNGSLRAAAALIEGGADLELPSGAIHGTPPLVWAIVGGQLPMVEFLAQGGAPVTQLEIGEALAAVTAHKPWTSEPPQTFQRMADLLRARQASSGDAPAPE